MQARKISPPPSPLKPALQTSARLVPRASQKYDAAKDILWIAIALQIFCLVANYLKISALSTTPMVLVLMIAPAAIIVAANTWSSAVKYSFLASLIVPLSTTLFMALVAVISFFLKPSAGSLIKHIGTSVSVTVLVWIIAFSASLPGMALGALARVVWLKVRAPIAKN